jgi:dihydrofolate synthase/folylpolyglutamate synthase
MTEGALAYIHSLQAYGSVPGLERIGKLLENLGNPHRSFPCIHVAGTSGKGSTCAILASCLSAHGYKTGLFVSPGIETFYERIQINGVQILPEELDKLTEQVRPIRDMLRDSGYPCTEFEFVTALAFMYYAQEKVDIAIIETGLGGRFDATNVVTPLLSIITPISLDHTEVLGKTIDKIAFEKAGIIKKGIPTVTGMDQVEEALEVIAKECKKLNSPLVRTQADQLSILETNRNGSVFVYREIEYHLSLLGTHQVSNAVMALEALDLISNSFPVSILEKQKGLSDVCWNGRLEKISDTPLIYLDGAHNPAKFNALMQAVTTLFPEMQLTVVMGMMSDKDAEPCVSAMASRASLLIATDDFVARKKPLDRNRLVEIAKKHCDQSMQVNSLKEAVDTALSLTPTDGIILVCGSLYLLGPMKKEFLSKLQI